VNREYRRGLRMHPCGDPVLRISGVEILLPTLTTWGWTVKEVQDPVAHGGVQTQGFMMSLEGSMVLNNKL
jgi:hypothetical protein